MPTDRHYGYLTDKIWNHQIGAAKEILRSMTYGRLEGVRIMQTKTRTSSHIGLVRHTAMATVFLLSGNVVASPLPNCEQPKNSPDMVVVWNTCRGMLRLPNHVIYIGDTEDFKLNGEGTATWPDGSKYVGEWKDNEFHGKGTYTWPGGETITAEWTSGGTEQTLIKPVHHAYEAVRRK